MLVGLVFDQFAPLFGVYSKTIIGGIYGDINGFIQAPAGAILTAFIGLFGGLFGYANAPIIDADTTYNNGLIEIFSQAPNSAYTIQNNGFVRDFIAPHIGGLTNFIGGINRLSCPSSGATIVTITEGFESIFECGFESPYVVILATNNIEMIGLFEALHSAFDTTNYGDIGHITSPYPTLNGVEFLGVFNEMNDSKINENEIYENEIESDILNYENKINENDIGFVCGELQWLNPLFLYTFSTKCSTIVKS